MNSPTTIDNPSTTMVSRITSERDGHTTFESSVFTSLKYCSGVVAMEGIVTDRFRGRKNECVDNICHYLYNLCHMATINISLPSAMLEDAKKHMTKRRYSSMSELVRKTLRKELYPHLTVNGFTPEFEEEVLRAEAEPVENDIVLETEKEIEDYFLHLKLPPKRTHAKDSQ